MHSADCTCLYLYLYLLHADLQLLTCLRPSWLLQWDFSDLAASSCGYANKVCYCAADLSIRQGSISRMHPAQGGELLQLGLSL